MQHLGWEVIILETQLSSAVLLCQRLAPQGETAMWRYSLQIQPSLSVSKLKISNVHAQSRRLKISSSNNGTVKDQEQEWVFAVYLKL